MDSININLMTCFRQDPLLLPNYINRAGFEEKGEMNFFQSKDKFRWVSIDNWKNETVVNFTANYIEVITNNLPDNKRIKLYFGLIETPNMITKAGKFWVDTVPNPDPKNRCIVSLQEGNICGFSLVNVLFGNQLDGEGWPSIKIYSSKFFVYF